MKDAMKKIGLLAGAAAFAFALSVPGAHQAEAAAIACAGVGLGSPFDPGAYDISGKVSPNNGCRIDSSITNDDVSGGNANFANFSVNLEAYFGVTEWLHLGKNNSPTNPTGTFDFGAFAGFGSLDTGALMLVFKDGNGTTLVAYRVTATSGTYSSPFTEPPFSFSGASPKNVSHISYYYTLDDGTTNESIPEPMTLALFGLGLAGLGAVARRRRAA